MRMGAVEWLLLLGLATIWAGTFSLVEIALRDVGPFTLVLGRTLLGAGALWLLVLATRTPGPRSLADWRDLAIMGLLNNALPFSLIFWGQTAITGGLASILNAMTPIFAVAVAHAFTRDERATPARLAGMALGLAGVIVLVGPAALAGLGSGIAGQVAVLCAALSYAFAGVFGRRLRRMPAMVAAAGMLTMSSVAMLPVALLAEGLPDVLPGGDTLLAWATLGIVCTALAYILYFRILALAGATNLLLVTMLIPPGAIALGVIFLDEPLEPRVLGGFALILCGLLAVDGRILDLLCRKQPA